MVKVLYYTAQLSQGLTGHVLLRINGVEERTGQESKVISVSDVKVFKEAEVMAY